MGCYEHQPNGQFSDHLFQSSRSSRLPNCHIRTTIRNEARHLDSFVSAFSSDGGISRDSTTSIYAQAYPVGFLCTRIIVLFGFGTSSQLQMTTISECRSRWLHVPDLKCVRRSS